MSETTVDPDVHTFTPIATLTRREDGDFDLTIDWSDSYYGSSNNAGDVEFADGEQVEAATAALDEWLRSARTKFIVARADLT